MKVKLAVWALLAVVAILYWRAGRPQAVADREPIDWSREPIQTPTDVAPFAIETRHGAVRLRPRAAYDVAAVVESRERYWADDTAFLSPLDLALAWGEVPTAAYRSKLEMGQSWRMFWWRPKDPAVDLDYVIRHTANTHVLPADANLRRALLAIERGDAIRLRGLLVDVETESWSWTTSLSRSDHGDIGCEVLWVRSVQDGDRLYE